MAFTIVIADDVTGANDIGIMYTKVGHRSVVYNYDQLDGNEKFDQNVTIIDTNSRFLNYEDAYQRVYNATKLFHKDQVHQFFNKQCSVFRGNIGAEFDAMLDALEEEFAIVVLGFPDNNRITIHGIHYVNGVKLEESQFKNDPVNPMTQSDLVGILQSQTRKKVSAIHYEVLDQGVAVLRQRVEQMKTQTNYVIIDVRDNTDLEMIAEVVKNEKVICGSSALAYYLGQHQAGDQRDQGSNENGYSNNKVLCIAGSLTPQTISQVAYMKQNNYPVLTLNTTKLFTKSEYEEEKNRILIGVKQAYVNANIVVIHSMNKEQDVEQTKLLGAKKEMDNKMVSEMVSTALSELGKEIRETFLIDKYIICGGDTSAAFCDKLNIKAMEVLEEIGPGLATCKSIVKPYCKLVLKSGSFGTEDFLKKAKEALI